ncbi:MAG: hypothetical protein D4R56_02755 [Deltaproteobacteria bacterium]|nr:MAG: hypothetical protein D4R56_02755 [Deltaproteobacteria bacterium]
MPKAWQPKTWLVFIYKVSSDPARKRVFVWRRLTQLGALYLQQAVCLFPHTRGMKAELEDLAERVRELEGEATLLRAASMDAAWEKDILNRFNADCDTLYVKIREETTKLVNEIKREEDRQHFTLGELDELEEWLRGLRRRFEKVKQRDFFKAQGAAQAQEALTAAEERVEIFTARVEQVNRGQ